MIYEYQTADGDWEQVGTKLDLAEKLDAGDLTPETQVRAQPIRLGDIVSAPLTAEKIPTLEGMDQLKLERPLIVFDLEATGTDRFKDRIVELAAIRIEPNGKFKSKRRLVNPTIPIPADSTAIHGIRDEDVRDEPTFEDMAKSIANFFSGADLCGYNLNYYDIPLLVKEFQRTNVHWDWLDDWRNRSVIDVFHLYQKAKPRSLSIAFQDLCGRPLTDAHSALTDVLGTFWVFLALMKGDQIPGGTLKEVEAWTEEGRENRRIDGVDFDGKFRFNGKDIQFTFGKYRNQSILSLINAGRAKEISGFLGWMRDNNFSKDTKTVASELVTNLSSLSSNENDEETAERWASMVESMKNPST